MYEEYTRQALPEKDYRELLGSSICVFNSNNNFIIENILRAQTDDTYDWFTLIDKESGQLKPAVKKIINNEEIYSLFEDIVAMRKGWEMLEYDESEDEISRSKKNAHNKDMANSAINWLIAQTRDSRKFYLVHEENMNLAASYNMLGLKPYAIPLNLVLLAANIAVLYFSFYPSVIFSSDYMSLIISTVVNLLFLAFWIAFVNDDLVKKSGHKYAKALLSCCDSPYLNKKE